MALKGADYVIQYKRQYKKYRSIASAAVSTLKQAYSVSKKTQARVNRTHFTNILSQHPPRNCLKCWRYGMKKLRREIRLGEHQVRSSISLSDKHLSRLKVLLHAISTGQCSAGHKIKRLNSDSDWLLVRMGIAIRVLILLNSQPREVWVIRRQELDRTAKAVKLHSKQKGGCSCIH